MISSLTFQLQKIYETPDTDLQQLDELLETQ